MKLKYNFLLREIAGEHVFIPQGENAREIHGIGSSNRTGCAIIEALKEDRTEDELAEIITDRFDIDRETAEKDIKAFIAHLDELGLLE